MPRGSRGERRGKLKWSNRSANRGRKGGLGMRKKFPTCKDVKARQAANRTLIVPPSDKDQEAAAAA